MAYDPSRIEPKWQKHWDEAKTFTVTEDPNKPKFYALDMFPYPSGKGLHVGHPAGYTASDVVARFKWAKGYNVLHPMGYDAFGLPAEQKAIEEGIAPQISTTESITTFRRQLKRLGYSYDWSREVSTCDPGYYKWTQWIFTRLHERGLAYQADVFVNWCPALGTVLANDEVIDGKSERGGHPVERRSMRQWMLRITAYAQRLLEDLDSLDWPEATKTRQREWIGRSDGAEVHFAVVGRSDVIDVFTTRPDTLWGVTYMVLAPEHPLVDAITTPAQKDAVDEYRRRTSGKTELDRQQSKEKTGVFTGSYARNPVNDRDVPIWIADYVILGYGTGAIMAVPGHDERDWAFARAMGLPIVEVISGGDVQDAVHAGEGHMVNSGAFDGTPTEGRAAVRKVTEWLEERELGKARVTYKLRDWIFARQRYWGEPIPVLKKEGEVVRALDLDELPLMLPPTDNYVPLGTGESPLAALRDWVVVKDPKTGQIVERETQTMPGSAGSSWYFLRYCDARNEAEFCARTKSDHWMPVDLYIGGSEHTVGHLLYARFWQKVLFDAGLVRDSEPFQKLRHQGMILAFTYYDPSGRIVPEKDVEERDGRHVKRGTDVELSARVEKMSKRKGNVVNPDELIEEYGSDAMRVYICFMGPLEADKPWQTNGLEGQFHWIKRAWRLFFDEEDTPRADDSEATEAELRILHKAVKKVSRDIESLDLNTAISGLHVAVKELAALRTRSRGILGPLAQIFAPFAPHFAEEVWQGLGGVGSVAKAAWPAYDDRYAVDNTIAMGVQIMGKTRGEIMIAVDADEATAVSTALAEPNIQRYLEGKQLARVIYKAGRILNLIVK